VTRAATSIRRRHLVWTTTPASRRDDGHGVSFLRLRAAILRTRGAGSVRSSLANPAAKVLAIYARHARITVHDVSCRGVQDLALLLGYVVEPAFRRDCALRIEIETELDALDPDAFVDPDWRYAWTLERLRWLVGCYQIPVDRPRAAGAHGGGRRWPWTSPPVDTVGRLDPEQSVAVRAGDGVVQVIAPAGSGKTTVLVARVK
jgi:hypothetical protein